MLVQNKFPQVGTDIWTHWLSGFIWLVEYLVAGGVRGIVHYILRRA